MKIPRFYVCTALLAGSLVALPVSAETLNTLAEFGNAADSNATSGAGTPRGADFTNAASGTYTLTAGGTDFWDVTDNGSFIFDNTTSRAAGENFSVIVRSVSVAGDPAEALAGEWGRTGPMARKTPDAANSANVAHIRKTGGAGGTVLQWRPNDGAGTTRDYAGDPDYGYHDNEAANTAAGDVRNTPLWLALHRVNGQWFSSWADDAGGTPGTWSEGKLFPGTGDLAGEVWVGLAHQSHNINPVINTALFEDFAVSGFNPDFGDFPLAPSVSVSLSGSDVFLSAFLAELGEGPSAGGDVDWNVVYRSNTGTGTITGSLQADIYLAANGGNIGALDTLIAGGPPAGTAFIQSIHWAANAYTTTNSAGTNLFAEAVPGSFLVDQENYAVNMTGEIHIPSSASRGGAGSIKFHDGVDDYCYLVIDGIPLIDDNNWSNINGDGNGGGAQVTFDCSDPKYNDGEWVSFRMATWEGGGGDDAILVWNALDSTGMDDVTGGVDATTGSYLGSALADGGQVPFVHNLSDKIPPQNFRRATTASVYEESGTGQPDMLQLGQAITAAVDSIEISVNGELVNSVPVRPTLETATFTTSHVITATLQDAGEGGTADIDPAAVMMSINGTMVTPDSISKTGTITTVVYTFPTTPDPLTDYTLGFMGNTTAATGTTAYAFSASRRSWPILDELRAGLPTPPNASVGWDYMEFDVTAALGAGLGANEQMFRDAQYVLRDAAAPLAEATVPFVNHYDPDSNAGGTGDFRPDMPILSDDVGTDDNQYVTLARTIVTIPAGAEGDYTFRIRGDDGYGLRVTGVGAAPDGVFKSIAGNAINMIDSRDRSVAYYAGGTGDSNAFAVCNLAAAGDYLIEFFAYEGGGGSFQEISWAKGSFNNLNQTSEFALLGDSSQFVGGTSVWGDIPAAVLPPVPSDSGWSTYIWYTDAANVGSIGNTMTFLQGVADPGAATATVLSELNHSDDAVDAGRFNPTAAFPGDPTPGGDTDNIAMLARAFITAPADGDTPFRFAPTMASCCAGSILQTCSTARMALASCTAVPPMRPTSRLAQATRTPAWQSR